MSETKKLITPKGRVSWCNLFTAKAGPQGGEPKFSCTLIFDTKAQETPEFKRMAEAAKVAAKEKWGTKIPANLRSPFRLGSEKAEWGYPEGSVFINVSTKNRPDVIDSDGQDVIDHTDVYSGCLGRASLSVYAYDQAGNRGVSFGLNNFQKLGDGEPMNGRTSARDDFGTVAAEDVNDDVDSYFSA